MNLPFLAPVYKWVAAGLGAAVLVLAVLLTLTSARLDTTKADLRTASIAITSQNAGIKALKAQAAEDRKAYVTGMKSASKEAAVAYRTAAELLAQTPIAKDELGICREARALIDSQLKENPVE